MNSITVLVLAAIMAISVAISNGPAPNSGDGIPDGSGNDAPYGAVDGRGPAPNAGDGIPDGSGF